MRKAEAFAPAKINLTLHVTGQRADGYHLLDSLVGFARDVGDRVVVERADEFSLRVTGPMADEVPSGKDNLVLRAARMTGVPVAVTLDKHLPVASGIGGGSSDAAATLRAIAALTGQPVPQDVVGLGADVPVCMTPALTRMRGIGEVLEPVADAPALAAVLVNPRVAVATPAVFRALPEKENPPMPDRLPRWADAGGFAEWLATCRNDLQAPAIELAPLIADVLEALARAPGCTLARLSGSGATCFGLFNDTTAAKSAAARLSDQQPGWWVRETGIS